MSSFVALVGRVPLVAWHDDQLGETLASFRKHKSHIAVVRNVNNTGPVRTKHLNFLKRLFSLFLHFSQILQIFYCAELYSYYFSFFIFLTTIFLYFYFIRVIHFTKWLV